PADGDETLLSALARAHHVARAQIDVVQREAQAFGRPHPRRVEQLEHGAIADAARLADGRCLDERGRRLPRERSRQRPRPARRLEMLGRGAGQRALAGQVLVEAPERRDAPRHARGPEAAGSEALEVLDDVVGADPTESAALVAQETGEIGEIAAVRVESIPGGPAFSLKGAEILNDDIGHRVTTSDNITTLPWGEARSSWRVALRGASARSDLGAPAALASRVESHEHRPLRHAERDARGPEGRPATHVFTPEPHVAEVH